MLLKSTDMTLQDIAVRMSCSKSSIVSINQTFRIREYHGRRRDWAVCPIPASDHAANDLRFESEAVECAEPIEEFAEKI